MSSPRLARGRFSEIGRIYSVTIVCHQRSRHFDVAVNVACFTQELQRLQDEDCVRNLAWVAMPDHVHWLFALHEGTLAGGVSLLKGRSSRRSGELREANSPFWQPGYFDHALRHDEALERYARYLVENPLRAGLVSCPKEYPHWWLSLIHI